MDFRAEAAYGAAHTEEREELDLITSGKINASVYATYFRSAGIALCVCVVICTALMQTTSSLYAFWLAYWVSHESHYTHAEFVTISAIIVAANLVCVCLRSVLFALGGLRAARRIYESLTESVFNTYLLFFETTSVGKIINRFAKVHMFKKC